jgi:parallel beta-helix repeat protein
MLSHRSLRRHVPVGAALIAACLCPPAAAGAGPETRTVTPASASGRIAVFRLQGVDPRAIRAARLDTPGASRALDVVRVRRAARSGRLRVRAGRRAAAAALVLTVRSHRGRRPGRPADPAPPTGPKPPPPPDPQSPSDPEPPSDPQPPPPPPPPPPPAGEPIPANAKYVSPAGSDANAGSAAAPWRTLSKALSAARPGDTVVLRAGSYGALGAVTAIGLSGTAAAPITIMGHPSEPRPVLAGYVKITGSHLRISNILFDGPTGRVLAATSSNPDGEEVQVSVMYGTDVEIRRSEVRDNAWHAGIFVWNATDVRLLGNYIHDNGDRSDPAQANFDHGIYWCSGSGTVANNVVENNYSYGVHLYPDAAGVTVKHNTIVGNDRGGVILAEAVSNSRVVNNIVAGNASYGIRGYAITGTGNVARGNLLWANGGRNLDGPGIAYSANLEGDPQFVGAADYHLRATSPAVNRGLVAEGVSTDHEWRARDSAPDVGAYELP